MKTIEQRRQPQPPPQLAFDGQSQDSLQLVRVSASGASSPAEQIVSTWEYTAMYERQLTQRGLLTNQSDADMRGAAAAAAANGQQPAEGGGSLFDGAMKHWYGINAAQHYTHNDLDTYTQNLEEAIQTFEAAETRALAEVDLTHPLSPSPCFHAFYHFW